MATHIVSPEDVKIAAAEMVTTLTPIAEKDWAIPAANLEWSSRFTLDHTVNALSNYFTHLATRAPARRPRFRDVNNDQTISELLTAIESGGAVLAEVCRAAPDDARGFHSAGMADWSGFIGMGCTEILIHTDDISRSFDVDFHPDPVLCRRVLDRLFPWAPAEGDAWQILRWAAGRTDLPDHGKLESGWFWHCEPLDDWDGSNPTRS
ncbi:MAG: hypothetical protein EA415_04700 [Sphaerobacteraceae bacterium]|nr:MAG: hypothetical protein EA415_04700 [Sphaerobacteraceae bacterium]